MLQFSVVFSRHKAPSIIQSSDAPKLFLSTVWHGFTQIILGTVVGWEHWECSEISIPPWEEGMTVKAVQVCNVDIYAQSPWRCTMWNSLLLLEMQKTQKYSQDLLLKGLCPSRHHKYNSVGPSYLTFSPLGPEGPGGPMGPVKPWERNQKSILRKHNCCLFIPGASCSSESFRRSCPKPLTSRPHFFLHWNESTLLV